MLHHMSFRLITTKSHWNAIMSQVHYIQEIINETPNYRTNHFLSFLHILVIYLNTILLDATSDVILSHHYQVALEHYHDTGTPTYKKYLTKHQTKEQITF